MKEKTQEPIPVVRIEHAENNVTEIFVLDEGDSMAWNSSTNYDHRMKGPSLVTKNSGRGTDIREHYVNGPDAWKWINFLMHMGAEYIEELDGHEVAKRRREIDKRMKEEYPQHRHVSMHKEKSQDS